MSDDDPREAARLEVVAFFDACEERGMAIDERVQEFAELAGCKKNTVYRWRSGDRVPQLLSVAAIHQTVKNMRKKYDMS